MGASPASAYSRPVPDPRRWLDEHHVAGPLIGETCFEVASGVPPAPGLLCRDTPPPTGGRRTVERLYRIDAVHVVAVWSGTVVDPWHWVHLAVDIGSDGSRLVLHDDTPCQCERAEREDFEKTASGVQPTSLSDGLCAACRDRGTYVWSGARYVRDLDAGGMGADCPVP